MKELLGVIALGATLFLVALHPVEWLWLNALRKLKVSEESVGADVRFLEKSLEIESIYYLFMFGFLILFFPRPILEMLVLVMVFLHLAAFHKTGMLLAGKRVIVVLVFDVVEVAVLVSLAINFYSFVV
jgi:hypothetical protein